MTSLLPQDVKSWRICWAFVGDERCDEVAPVDFDCPRCGSPPEADPPHREWTDGRPPASDRDRGPFKLPDGVLINDPAWRAMLMTYGQSVGSWPSPVLRGLLDRPATPASLPDRDEHLPVSRFNEGGRTTYVVDLESLAASVYAGPATNDDAYEAKIHPDMIPAVLRGAADEFEHARRPTAREAFAIDPSVTPEQVRAAVKRARERAAKPYKPKRKPKP